MSERVGLNNPCELCRAAETEMVLAGPGPVSLGYCRPCAKLGVYPYDWVLAYLFTCWPDVNEWGQEMVEASCKYAGKTLEEFSADCAKAMDDLGENLERLECEHLERENNDGA